MPATVPFVGPKKRADESLRGKEDDNPEIGGAGWGVTGWNRRPERPVMGAQDVVKAHEAKQNTAHTPTPLSRLMGRVDRCDALRRAERAHAHAVVAVVRLPTVPSPGSWQAQPNRSNHGRRPIVSHSMIWHVSHAPTANLN